MHVRLFAIALVVLSLGGASATTYDYAGQDLFEPAPNPFSFSCNPCDIGHVTGLVSFAQDTSSFTGTLQLSAGDIASFTAPVPIGFGVGPGGPFNYPVNNPPPGTFGIVTSFRGLSPS
jgi:hypothetical protein